MNLEDIQRIVSGVVENYRTAKGWKEEAGLVDYYEGYKLSVEMADAIKVHSVKGVFPDKLIAKRSPNQTDAEFTYVKENYKQVTLPVFVDLISTIQRAFSDNNWSIQYPADESGDSLQIYLEEGLKDTPLKMSLEAWVKGVLPSIKMIDANACVAVKPYEIPTVNQDGVEVISAERFKPVPFYYESRQVVGFDEGEWYLFELKEKSEVKIGDRTVKEGLIYEFYDKNFIWRIEQTGLKKDYVFNFIPYFEHNLGVVPVTRLKGRAFYHEGQLMWASEFLSVTDILDDAVLDGCNLRGIKATCVYPYRVMTGQPCDEVMTINGETQCCNGTGHFNDLTKGVQITCPRCNGNGLKDRISPYGVMLLRPGSLTDESELKATQPAMYYVSPSIDTPEFLRSEISKHLDQARAILHLRTSASEVKGAEDMTATGKALDQKALYSFIKSISDQIFGIYEDVVKWITWMGWGTDYELPVITAPISFDLKDESEYLNDIGQAVEKNVPAFVVQANIYKYLSSLFYNTGDVGTVFNIMMEADRLLVVPSDEIALKQTRGLVSNWEVVLHDSGVTLIKELIREKPNYLNLELSEQISLLIAKAQEKANAIKTTTPTIADRLLGNTTRINPTEGGQA